MSAQESGATGAVSVEVRRGAPSAEELAALIAVVSEAYAGEVDAATADDAPSTSAWMQTRRALRRPLARELGWRHAR
ncbi:acyl-CoA carboxylase epsilon subunit [Microbacterium fluvii]|uniref:Acyl-CoA carboxylase epsilon subunit n=1 Tax=Microbacterium fluvii TaxID=415215 RepID=A0ABW2HBE0_9MICO|nr:acyl-CoA carboxylase epsilon subunit [Microbacterium fluvii]MCU4671406.1 acyl-CoA carboxylase subunit epsilon [Microbacterium fluvii]